MARSSGVVRRMSPIELKRTARTFGVLGKGIGVKL
jgi:hypothetical protein